MAASGQLTSPALQALLQDGSLAGSWTLDPGAVAGPAQDQAHVGAPPALRRLPAGQRERHGDRGRGRQRRHHRGRRVDRHEELRRDTHLRSAGFFDVANHPDFTFAADSVRPAEGGASQSLT